MTVLGPGTRVPGGVEVPVVGGLVVVLVDGADADRLLAGCAAGARLDCRIADAGDGWWVATAARVERGAATAGPPEDG